MLTLKPTGSPNALALLNCLRLPERLNTTQTAVLLGFHDHDITSVVNAQLLVPLRKPAPNAPKYFAAVEITAFAENKEWLDRATKALTSHWRKKNGRKTLRSRVAPGRDGEAAAQRNRIRNPAWRIS